MAEPDPATLTPDGQIAARPAHVLRLTYDDGPRDCEAIAIDPGERAIYLLTKRTTPPRLYRVALPTRGWFGRVRRQELPRHDLKKTDNDDGARLVGSRRRL